MEKKELLRWYHDMLHIRRFEERVGQLYGMGLIGGFCHLYIGQEAIVVGMQAAIKEKDSIITTYRDHGHMLAAGCDPLSVLAELMGKYAGCSKGKGGSMHMFDLERCFYGGHGIVGASVPLGTGLAFSHKYHDTDRVSLTYFGDGAINQGQVYEAFNMASLWKLPVVYIVENNHYAMGTSVVRSSATTELYKRGEGFGIPGYKVNGMNVLEVYEAGKKAVDHCRAGKGPILLEMDTYRYRGHSMSDPGKYREKEEIETMKVRDPLESLKQLLLQKDDATEASLKEMDKNIRDNIAAMVVKVSDYPEPPAEELYEDIYIN